MGASVAYQVFGKYVYPKVIIGYAARPMDGARPVLREGEGKLQGGLP